MCDWCILIPVNSYVFGVCILQIQANVRVLTQERDSVNALYTEVDI